MTNKLIAVIATLALCVALGVAILGVRTVNTTQKVDLGGVTNFDSLNLDSGDLTLTNGNLTITNGAGAGAGTSTLSSTNRNGLIEYMARCSTFQQATTTLCAVQAPNATTTLTFGSVQTTVATATNLFFDIAQAASAFTTTTQIGTTFSWSDSATAGVVHDDLSSTIIASTSPSAANNAATIIAPNQWIVVKVTSKNNDNAKASSGYSLTGAAEFILEQN